MRISRRTFLAALVAAVAACSDPTGFDTIAGRYDLQSVNGEMLPFIFMESLNQTAEFTAGDMQINGDGTCSLRLTSTTTTTGQVSTDTETTAGTWSRTGTAVFFQWSDGSIAAGSVTDDDLSLTLDGLVYRFTR